MADQQTPKNQNELSTWQEIAEHLNVSVRTAQNYERRSGLPVRRMAGLRGRVIAYRADLDRWKADQFKQTPVVVDDSTSAPLIETEPTPPTRFIESVNRPQRRRTSYFTAAIVIPIIIVGVYWATVPHGPPTDFRVDGKDLFVFNAKGQELWRHIFPVLLEPSFYIKLKQRERSWIGDLDGDCDQELVFIVEPENRIVTGTWVVCFSSKHRTKWEFKPERAVTDRGGNHYLPPYFIHGVQVILGKTPERTRVIISSNHYVAYPNPVTFLDASGRVMGEYWHPGHLLNMGQADLDGDSNKEVLLAGVNNASRQATLVVLDPLTISGL
jgi:hypothetical protein